MHVPCVVTACLTRYGTTRYHRRHHQLPSAASGSISSHQLDYRSPSDTLCTCTHHSTKVCGAGEQHEANLPPLHEFCHSVIRLPGPNADGPQSTFNLSPETHYGMHCLHTVCKPLGYLPLACLRCLELGCFIPLRLDHITTLVYVRPGRSPEAQAVKAQYLDRVPVAWLSELTQMPSCLLCLPLAHHTEFNKPRRLAIGARRSHACTRMHALAHTASNGPSLFA